MTLDELLATLTPEQREGVEREFQKLRAEHDAQGAGGGAVAWRCTGCGRITQDQDSDIRLLEKSGAISCCPEREMVEGRFFTHPPSLASDFTMEDAEKLIPYQIGVQPKWSAERIGECPHGARTMTCSQDYRLGWNDCRAEAVHELAALNATFPKGRPAGEVVDSARELEQRQLGQLIADNLRLRTALRKYEGELTLNVSPTPAAHGAVVQNLPIAELMQRYTEEDCDFTDMVWVRATAERYVSTMPDSQIRCLLHALAAQHNAIAPDGGETERRINVLEGKLAIYQRKLTAAESALKQIQEIASPTAVQIHMIIEEALHPTAPAGEGGERT